MRFLKKIQYNSPVVLSFAFISLAELVLSELTGGMSTRLLFSVYRSSLLDLLTYPRFFLHVLGHLDFSHYIGNMLLLLVIGPPLEERYGSRDLLMAIAATALVSGLVQFVFFPNTYLLGASGIVFMMIVLSSFAGMDRGRIPITLILVFVLYIGDELVSGLSKLDNVSQLTHIVGGSMGAALGFLYFRRHR